MSEVIENVKSELKHPIGFLASIITIVNFIWTLMAFNAHQGIPSAAIPVGSVAIGIILACFLESFLAAAFGYAIVYMNSKGKGLPYLLSIVLMLLSAWTSLFNIQWLVLGSAPDSAGDLFALFALGTLFAGFACYLIGDHVAKFKVKFSSVSDIVNFINSEGGLYVWQVLSFVLMFGIIWGQTELPA
ncbi:hypothetical protein ACI8HB_003629, partial [Vibrio cholerae]